MITGVTPEWHQRLSIKQVVFLSLSLSLSLSSVGFAGPFCRSSRPPKTLRGCSMTDVEGGEQTSSGAALHSQHFVKADGHRAPIDW